MDGTDDPMFQHTCYSFLWVLHSKQLQGRWERWASHAKYLSQDLTIILKMSQGPHKITSVPINRKQSRKLCPNYQNIVYECLFPFKGDLVTKRY